MTVEEDRRRHPRVKLGLPATCDLGGERCPGSIIDIAHGGAFVLVEAPRPELAAHVMLRLWVGDAVCEAWGAAVRTLRTKAGPAVGVRFDGENEAFQTWVGTLSTADEADRAEHLTRVRQAVVFFIES